MNYYIQQEKIYTIEWSLYKKDGYDLSTTETLEDFNAGKIIKLNAAQTAFYLANPNATTTEIFNCALLTPPEASVSTEQAKKSKILALDKYDNSDEVNTFTINGQTMWLSKEERVALMQRALACQAKGITELYLWTKDDTPMKLPITPAELISKLQDFEIYAGECYDTKAQHKVNIQSLTTQEDVYAYDFKTGYPEKLSFSL